MLDVTKSLVTGDCALGGMVKVFVWALIGAQVMGSAYLLPVFADEKAWQALSSCNRLSDPFDDLD